MTDANIFQVLGLVYLFIGLGMLVSPRFYKEALIKMMDNEAILFITGILVFILGYLLVAYHHVWAGGWPVVITVIGWVAVLKGLMILFVPEGSVRIYRSLRIAERQMGFYGLVASILGIILAYIGYFIL